MAEDPLFRGYKGVEDLAQAHKHLTALKGVPANELLRIPAKPLDQAPDDWKPIFKAIGVPEDGKDYKIEIAAEAATDAPALAETLRELGLKANLNQAGMNVVVETLNTLGKQAAEAEVAEVTTLTAETTAQLKKEQGAAYEGNTRAIGKLIADALAEATADIKDPAAKAAAIEAQQADLTGKLASNLTLSRILALAVGKMAEPETPGETRPGGAQHMTPAAAKAALSAKYADKDWSAALNSRSHPQHAAVLAERDMLLAQQRGEKRPDQAA